MKIKIFATLALLFVPLFAAAESGKTEQVAVGVAQSWLAQVDGGDYASSWGNTSALFKNTVDKQQWEKVAKDARQPFGDVVGRSLKSATYTTTLPNAPAGEYVVIVFDSEFSKQKSATETITPMLGEDGKWRVGGYYIK